MSSLSACRKLHCNSMFFYQILKLLVFRLLQQVEIFYKLLQKGLNILHIFSDTFIHQYNVGLSMHSNVVVVVSINKQQTIAFSTSTIVSCPPLSFLSLPCSPGLWPLYPPPPTSKQSNILQCQLFSNGIKNESWNIYKMQMLP